MNWIPVELTATTAPDVTWTCQDEHEFSEQYVALPHNRRQRDSYVRVVLEVKENNKGEKCPLHHLPWCAMQVGEHWNITWSCKDTLPYYTTTFHLYAKLEQRICICSLIGHAVRTGSQNVSYQETIWGEYDREANRGPCYICWPGLH